MIAQEGQKLTTLLAAASMVLTIALDWVYALGGWSLVAILVFLYRDSRHRVPPVPLAIVSPASGLVVQINEVADPWLEREAKRVRIKLSAFGPFALFSPTEGKIMRQWLGHCTGANAVMQDAVCQTAWIQTDEGDDVIMVVHPRMSPGVSRCQIQTGERLGQGKRCGFMFAGGFVDLLLPKGTRIEVALGQEVEAGADIIGKLIHHGEINRNLGLLPSARVV